MENNYEFDKKTEDRSLRGIHSQFNSMMGYSSDRSKVQFEKPENIRKGLSGFSVESGQYTEINTEEWDPVNYGGVPLDYDDKTGTVYVDSSDAHTLLIGSTGSKKSRLVAIPAVLTLASVGESMLICDPKGEIYKKTASVLNENGYSIGLLNLREPEYGDSWNVLTIPYKYYCSGEVDKSCEFINDFAINIMPLYSSDPYWDYSARDLLFGLTLLLFRICKEGNEPIEKVNIASVLELKQALFSTTNSSQIMHSNLWKYIEKDHLVKNRLIGTIICPEKTMSCILSTFDQQMSCFSLQPKVTNMLSFDSLDLDGLGKGKKAVFIIMPDEKTTYHKIVSVFIKETYEYLINSVYKEGEDNRFPIRINYILDEFSSLPKISDFPQMIAVARSRNIRFLLIVQSKHQLLEKYGEESQTIQSNCSNWMFLFSREITLLDEISNLCGRMKGEPLVSPFLLQHLDKKNGECLLMLGRYKPYIAHLPDIESYTYVAETRSSHEKHIDNRQAIILTIKDVLCFINETTNEDQKNTNSPVHDTSDSKDELYIKKELEKKFDELFGSLETDDNDE